MNKKGILIVVSGFSGAGKGTLMNFCRNMKRSMRYLFRQQQDSQEKEKFMDASIFSFQKMNLKK